MHIVIGTHNAWRHGDARGFRSRGHRLHSSGDYKARPPAGEHARLRQFHDQRSGEPVDLDVDARVIICRTFVMKWRAMGYRIIARSVGKRHLQAIVEGPDDYALFDKEVGRAKQAASHAVRRLLPGTIWAANGGFKPVRGAGHFRNSYKYVRTCQEAGTIVWSHLPDENWAEDELVGIVLMRGRRDPVRLTAASPTSAGTPPPGRG